MKQQKKKLFDLYPRLTDGIYSQYALAFGQKEAKSLGNSGVLREMLDGGLIDRSSIENNILAEEHFWERSGSHIIFPESSSVLDNLLRAKFSFESAKGLTFPFCSFILSIPNGYQHQGVKLPSFQVSTYQYAKSQDLIFEPFFEDNKIKSRSQAVLVESGDIDERVICITYRDPNTKEAYSRVMKIESSWPALLSCKSRDEFRQMIGEYGHGLNVMAADDYDLDIQSTALRLVIAMAIYNQAKNGEKIIDGFPTLGEPRMNNRVKTYSITASTLSDETSGSHARSPETHLRTWFFRQLMDEKYYRGEHEAKPIGSRITFVSPAIVGAKAEVHTQKY